MPLSLASLVDSWAPEYRSERIGQLSLENHEISSDVGAAARSRAVLDEGWSKGIVFCSGLGGSLSGMLTRERRALPIGSRPIDMGKIEEYWLDVGGILPEELNEARIEGHCAAQLVAAAADAFLENDERGTHRVLSYLPEAGVVATERLDGETPMRFGLALSSLELVVLDPDGARLDSLPLVGQTLGTALDWISDRAEKAGNPAKSVTLPTELKLPLHPLLGGATFSDDVKVDVQEIGRYFSDTELLLKDVRRETKGSGRIEFRPEGFEMRVRVAADKDGGHKRVAAGFSPGNRHIPEPFWYVVPRPAPAPGELVVIAEPGEWVADHLRGAALKSSDLLKREEKQCDVVAGFYRRALTVCRGLIA